MVAKEIKMYVVLVNRQPLAALQSLMPEINKAFPSERFSIWGSDEKGYQIRIEGTGSEIEPRKFAELFLKKWKAYSAS